MSMITGMIIRPNKVSLQNWPSSIDIQWPTIFDPWNDRLRCSVCNAFQSYRFPLKCHKILWMLHEFWYCCKQNTQSHAHIWLGSTCEREPMWHDFSRHSSIIWHINFWFLWHNKNIQWDACTHYIYIKQHKLHLKALRCRLFIKHLKTKSLKDKFTEPIQ